MFFYVMKNIFLFSSVCNTNRKVRNVYCYANALMYFYNGNPMAAFF